METAKIRTEEQVLEDKIENLIAIGRCHSGELYSCKFEVDERNVLICDPAASKDLDIN